MINVKNFKIIEKLKRNDLGFKLIIGIIFWICLTLFLHFRQIKFEMLELNSFAPHYIVAQKDFDFFDEEKTIASKQKILSKFQNIYIFNKEEINQKRIGFEKYYFENQNLLPIFFDYENIYDVLDLFENILMNAKFVDYETKTLLKKIVEDIQNYYILDKKNNEESFVLPKCYLAFLAKKLNKDIPNELIDYMINYFEKGNLILSQDHKIQDQIKKQIEKENPEQYTHIKAGELIIGNNEKVTSRHIAMLQAMKEAISKKEKMLQPFTLIGNFLISFIFIFLSILYFKIEQPKLLKSLKQISLVVTILLLTLLFSKIVEYILLNSKSTHLEATRYPIIVPFATLLFSILFNIRISLFFSILLSIALSLILTVEYASFLVINIVASLIVIISTRCLRKRTEVFEVCGKSMFGVGAVIIALFFINNKTFNLCLLAQIVSSFFALLVIGIIVVGLLPVLETIFDVLTDITLMEYMDPNNELLRRLTLEIPGSYQHSLVLGNLAEAAAQEIKANPLFCRVATLYHDIGKLNNPNYFIENQKSNINIHQLLTPFESAQVIISHVIEGEMLGKKYRLPKKILDVIKQHHGTTLVYYFFRKETELKGKELIDQTQFRYPGPKPQTKEAAIIMIADSVEAASRSLEKISEKVLSTLVNKIVKEKADDGQFDDCSLTFEELKIVKRSIVKTLLLTRHIRIKYPDKKEEKLNIYLEPYCLDKSI